MTLYFPEPQDVNRMRVTAQLNDSSFLTWHHLPDSNPNQDYCQRSVGSWLIGATLIVCLPKNMCQLHFAGGQIFTKKKAKIYFNFCKPGSRNTFGLWLCRFTLQTIFKLCKISLATWVPLQNLCSAVSRCTGRTISACHVHYVSCLSATCQTERHCVVPRVWNRCAGNYCDGGS